MNYTPDTGTTRDRNDEFPKLLGLIGIRPDERISICSQKADGSRFESATPRNRDEAERLVASGPFAERDVWFSVNPVVLPAGYHGRGGDEHVSRCVALFADVDIKAGGVSDSDVASAVTETISAALGAWPVAVVFTGHGGHAYWALDPGDDDWTLSVEEKRADARALYRRFHRMCADIAARHGGSVDNVSQPSRILRVPGTFNRKDPADPLYVNLTEHPYGTGMPLSREEVVAALDTYGVPQLPEDSAAIGAVVSEPASWEFGVQTTPYVAAMIAGWRIDRPNGGRHPWLLSQATRLACAHRLGWITDDDHDKAVLLLEQAFETLLFTHGHRRQPHPGEVEGALAWGIRHTASFSDERAATELGGNAESAGTPGASTKSTTVGDGLPRLRRATDMKPARPMEWLAKGNVPKAAVTLLVGDEGIGKSTFWVWLVARITTGEACPEYGLPGREAQEVVLVVTEDDWSSAVRPRLEAAGADLSRVHVFSAEEDGSGSPIFPDHLHILTTGELAPVLVVVDAWLDTVPAGLLVKDPQHARQVLHPWKEYATSTGSAILLLTHTNRVPTANPRDKYGATAELRKTARQTLYAVADPEADDCMIVGPEKSNNVARGAEATRFRIVPVKFADPTEDSDGIVTVMQYCGSAGRSIRELIAEAHHTTGSGSDDDKLSEAVDWLEDYLTETTPSKVVKAAAKDDGISESTLRRAAKKLHVISTSAGFPRTTHWTRPGGLEMSRELPEAADSPAEKL